MQDAEEHWANLMLTPENPERNGLVPFEVLGEIFSYISCDGPLHLRHVLLVCRLWYHSVVNHPQLWCKIAVDEIFLRRFHSGSMVGGGERFLGLCISRSGDLPLHLVVSGRHVSLNSLVRLSHVGNVLRLLARWHTPSGEYAMSHLESIHWRFSDDDEEISLFRAYFPAQLPRLRVLSIRTLFLQRHICGAGVPFPQCPKLQEVYLVDHFEERRYFTEENFGRARLLDFTGPNGRGWSLYDVVCIGRFAALHTLVLRDLGMANAVLLRLPVQDTLNVTQVELVRLQVLRIIGPVPSVIFHHLEAPALQTLQFQSNDFKFDSLATFGTPSMVQNVQKLYLSLTGWRDWQGEPVKLIEELLSACVMLERVYASGFLQERLPTHSIPANAALLLDPDFM